MKHFNEHSGDIRALSPNEIEAVSGGIVIGIGPVNIGIAEGSMMFGIGIVGVGAFGLEDDGSVCVVNGEGEGGCVRPNPDPWRA